MSAVSKTTIDVPDGRVLEVFDAGPRAACYAVAHMEIGVRDLRNRTAQVIDAVRAGERVTLTVHGEAIADIVPHGARTRWLAGQQLREALRERAADPAMQAELDALAGQTLAEL